MSRYIDADALLAKQETIELPDPYGGEYNIDIVHSYDVKNAPTADVVAVVRCKDCKYFTEEMIADDLEYICKCFGGMINISPDYYCSRGERI